MAVSSRATQASVDAIEGKLDASLDVAVSSRATQASVDAIEAKLDARLDATVSSRATQASVDAIEAKLDARLDATVSSRATQASLDDHDENLDTQTKEIDDALAALETKVDNHDTNITNLVNDQTDQIDETLSTVIDKETLELQVLGVKDNKRFLILATESGVPAATAAVDTVVAVTAKGNKPAVATDVTVHADITVVSPGLFDFSVDLKAAGKPAKDAKTLIITVVDTHGSDPSHSGTIMIKGKGDDGDDDSDDD